jgi:hypothetical protein
MSKRAVLSGPPPLAAGGGGGGGGGGYGGGYGGAQEDAALGEFSGWMLKAAPKMVDADKADSLSRRLRRVANHVLRSMRRNADFKRRFFVLDAAELRYYRDDTLATYSGAIDLSTVLEVQWADRAGVPAFAIDLVSAAARAASPG